MTSHSSHSSTVPETTSNSHSSTTTHSNTTGDAHASTTGHSSTTRDSHASTVGHSSSIVDNHSNTNDVTVSGSIAAQTHSVSFTSTNYTSMPSTLESSLTTLINAANEARESIGSPRLEVENNGDEHITGRKLKRILRSSGGTVSPRYNWGTVKIDVNNLGAHTNSSWTNTSEEPPILMDNDYGGYHANTASIQDPLYTNDQIYPEEYMTVSRDEIATQDQVDEALAIINAGRLNSNITSWGTYEISGTIHDNTYGTHSSSSPHTSTIIESDHVNSTPHADTVYETHSSSYGHSNHSSHSLHASHSSSHSSS